MRRVEWLQLIVCMQVFGPLSSQSQNSRSRQKATWQTPLRSLPGRLEQGHHQRVHGRRYAVLLAETDDDTVAGIDFHGPPGAAVGQHRVGGIARTATHALHYFVRDLISEH